MILFPWVRLVSFKGDQGYRPKCLEHDAPYRVPLIRLPFIPLRNPACPSSRLLASTGIKATAGQEGTTTMSLPCTMLSHDREYAVVLLNGSSDDIELARVAETRLRISAPVREHLRWIRAG